MLLVIEAVNPWMHARIACWRFARLCSRLAKFLGDYLAIHFQLTDILKRLTCQVGCLDYGDHLRWIEGEVVERLIGIGHDVSSEIGGAGSDAAKRRRDEQGNLALTSRALRLIDLWGHLGNNGL
jgi:hypothetical protein